MLRFMWQKIIHKKWMVISLLIGNILLVAIAVSHPMYQKASLQRMLSDEFTQYLEKYNEYPAMIQTRSTLRKTESNPYYNMKDLTCQLSDILSLPVYQIVTIHNLQEAKTISLMNRNDKNSEFAIQIASMPNLEEHSKIISGRMYEEGIQENGFVEAILSESAMVNLNLLVGDELEMTHQNYQDDTPIRIRIVGIYENSESNDAYWVKSPDEYKKDCFIAANTFDQIFFNKEDERFYIRTNWYVQFDYDAIQPSQVPFLISKATELTKTTSMDSGMLYQPNFLTVLNNFESSQKRISVTLMILEVPVLVLLCSFLFMISGQLLDLEQNEISQLKSRGAGKSQIFFLYLLQSLLLALFSLLIGIPFGSYLCQVLGSSNAFLEFVQRRPLTVHMSGEVLAYATGAAMLSVLMTTLPVIKYSKASIVHVKQKKNRNRKPFWQKLGLDVVALLISMYGYYVFNGQKEELAAKVFAGKALDPLLFICSSLFILGAGLLCLRLQPLLVKFLFFIGKRRWNPASYASFLQTIRTGTKQYFIMTFLMLTVSLGIFNATVARTILSNAENNMRYGLGADLVVKELWKSNEAMVRVDPSTELVYEEADFGKFKQFEQIKSVAKVWKDENASFRINRKENGLTVMGINTKDFGETTTLDHGLLHYDYHEYLNAMSTDANAVLVSMNFKNQLGYAIGEKIEFTGSDGQKMSGTIYGFVDYWPSYIPESITLQPDKTAVITPNYLIIAHLSTIQSSWGITPYEVWMDIDGSHEFFYNYIEKEGLVFTKFIDAAQEATDIRNATLFQGTNGILTMSFIVILILCCVGFLIYWILSIRSRELLFGVLRAMGMGRKQILHMLVNEQIFSGVFSITAGIGIGFLSSRLFVPLIQIAYSATNQVLPLKLITRQTDINRLFAVIGVVFIGCMIILARLIFTMKISQALKLGED